MTDNVTLALLENIKTVVKAHEDKGYGQIPTEYLKEHIHEIEKSFEENPPIDEVQLEILLADDKNQTSANIAKAQLTHSTSLEMFKSIISTDQNALRGSLLINGIAAVSTLTFIGHLVAASPITPSSDKINSFGTVLLLFIIGVFCSGISMGTTYITQYAYSYKESLVKKIGITIHFITIVLYLAAYVFFALGVYKSWETFKSF